MTEPVMLHCTTHGDYLQKVIEMGALVIRQDRCSACLVDELAAEAAQVDARDAMARQARLEKNMGQAGVPAGFVNRTLQNFASENDGQVRALRVSTDYAASFASHRKTGKSLMYLGGIGTGKTHLAVGIASAVLAMGYTALYETASDLVTRLRDCMRKDSNIGTGALLETYGNIDFLVLDEFGVQGSTDDVKAHLTNVIDRRYRNSKPTLFISNLNKEEFVDYIGERNADRLRERASLVVFDWESQRAKARINAGF